MRIMISYYQRRRFNRVSTWEEVLDLERRAEGFEDVGDTFGFSSKDC